MGGPGSGKTTVAREAARRLDLTHHELDGLWWEPGWSPVGSVLFLSRVREVLARGSWVLDGNYFDQVAGEVWPQADLVVWLDLSRRRCVGRAVIRTASRSVSRRELWNGNRESLRNLSPASVLRLVRRWPSYNARISVLLKELGVTTVLRLDSPQAVRAWLAGLGACPQASRAPSPRARNQGEDR